MERGSAFLDNGAIEINNKCARKPGKNLTLEKKTTNPKTYERLKSTCAYPPNSPIPFARFLIFLTLSGAVAARLRILNVSKEGDIRGTRRGVFAYGEERVGRKYTKREKWGVKEITSWVDPPMPIRPCFPLSAIYSSDRCVTQNKAYYGSRGR